MPINHQTTITLNGVPQYVSIRAERDHLPLLLYLHGGPGDAALPLVLKYNSELEKHFTLSSGFASSSGGVGGMGVLLGTPSIMLQFCSVESSAVFR